MAFGMAGWCRDLIPKGAVNVVPGNHFELADGTQTTVVQALAARAKFFRAVVYVKNVATGAASTSFFLEAGTTSTLGTFMQHIDNRTFSGSAGSYSFILQGFAPDAGLGPLSFVRVAQAPNSGSWTFDCIIDCI